MKYLNVWKQLTNLAFSSTASNRIDAGTYLIGKMIRFGFFWLLIVSIFIHTNLFAGYDQYQILLFFLTFNVVDVGAQAFLRGIYLMREDVRKGNFDYLLTKPINTLFHTLSRLTDILDFLFLLPVLGLLVYVLIQLSATITFTGILWYIAFLGLSFTLVVSIHIMSASLTIWTMESENGIWFYRESMTLGRFPPEIFSYTVQMIFTFILPVIVMVAFPVKALLGTLSVPWILTGISIAILFAVISLQLWKKSLSHYSSASS